MIRRSRFPRAGHLAAVFALGLIHATAAAIRPAEPADAELTVLTWNLLHGANERGELDLEAQAGYILRQTPHFAFVQEIDDRCVRSGRVDQMAVLARLTGMGARFGAFMPFDGGRYGLGTLSALPLVADRTLELPPGGEPRVALLTEVELLGRTLLAVNVHFDWRVDDAARFAQASVLAAELAAVENAILLAGDFNDVPESRTLALFYAAGFEHVEPPGASWSASRPSVDIDHVLVRDGRDLALEPLGGEVLPESELSDHRPVLARVRARSRQDGVEGHPDPEDHEQPLVSSLADGRIGHHADPPGWRRSFPPDRRRPPAYRCSSIAASNCS